MKLQTSHLNVTTTISHHFSQPLLPVKQSESRAQTTRALHSSILRFLSLEQDNTRAGFRAGFSWSSIPHQWSQLGLRVSFLPHSIWGLWPRHHRHRFAAPVQDHKGLYKGLFILHQVIKSHHSPFPQTNHGSHSPRQHSSLPPRAWDQLWVCQTS